MKTKDKFYFSVGELEKKEKESSLTSVFGGLAIVLLLSFLYLPRTISP
jgi:hypothetical protein